MPDPRPRLLIVDDDRAITSTVGPLLRELADVDTVANITALTRPAGTMGFATDASGGAKPCWSTGSGWVLASGTTLT